MNLVSGTRTKVIAQYFPQLYRIPENDAWWGPGFTDWVNVRRARPLFTDHHQPRVPLRYYDQSREEVIRWQVDCARQYGVYGFCHYHYWFDGKQLLEAPTNLFLNAKDIPFRLCLAWANETWSRRWDGQNHHILQAQTHPAQKERWELHFRYLIKAWLDERYIRVDGRPLFLVYRPQEIACVGDMFDYWKERAYEYGLPGLYFVAMNHHYGFPAPDMLRHFDAVMHHEPFAAMSHLREGNRPLWWRALRQVGLHLPDRARFAVETAVGPRRIDYDAIWQAIIAQPSHPGKVTLRGAFTDWDNTPRYGRRAIVFRGSSPERFEFWMRRLFGAASENREEERFVFINAWNEWAEGAHLEPDERHQYRYLEALSRALGVPQAIEELRPHRVAVEARAAGSTMVGGRE